MSKPFLLALFLIVAGGGIWLASLHWPYYINGQDPCELSNRLQSLPEGERFKEWDVQLRRIETPRKAFADWGLGVAGLGLGLSVVVGISAVFPRIRESRRKALFFALWIGSWLICLPGSLLYYEIRYKRFDYPVWGDSIAIPLYENGVGVLIGCVITTLILPFLLMRRDLPVQWKFIRPMTRAAWGRFVFLSAWIVLLLVCLLSEIPDGDVGNILMLLWTGSLLLLVLSAPKKQPALV